MNQGLLYPFYNSGSSCSLAAGLESLGLTDIRTLVRLMCLAAAGRAGLSTSPSTVSSSTERSRGIHSKTSKPISCLAYLSTAVGCLASNTPSAAKLLVQLCTQVGLRYLLETTLIICAFIFSAERISLESSFMALHRAMLIVGKNQVTVSLLSTLFKWGKWICFFC